MTHRMPTVDELAELCLPGARIERHQLMGEINSHDLTGVEMMALLAVLRPAVDRLRPVSPPAQLGLVREGREGSR
ncbi:MAG: hypothetical protein JWR32_2618 [Mycobacterium sp.]|jgi:hypothetical protein|nr:hypothetical protein [Mycobacterium sp.]MEA2669413.1 hypothetical protein [Chloroflexota bacterium]